MRRPNAFTIHRLPGSGAFPFTGTLAAHGAFVRATVCPLDIATAWTAIRRFVHAHVAVHDLAVHREEGALRQYPTCDAVRDTGHDGPDVVDAIALPRREIQDVLDKLVHHDLGLVDHRTPLQDAGLLDLYLELHTAGGDSPLSSIRAASISLHAHDDCYLQLDARDPAVADALLQRAFGAYAWTTCGMPEGSDPDDLPADLLRHVLGAAGAFTALRDHAVWDGDMLSLPFSRRPFNFYERRLYPVDGLLTWSITHGWAVDEDISASASG